MCIRVSLWTPLLPSVLLGWSVCGCARRAEGDGAGSQFVWKVSGYYRNCQGTLLLVTISIVVFDSSEGKNITGTWIFREKLGRRVNICRQKFNINDTDLSST